MVQLTEIKNSIILLNSKSCSFTFLEKKRHAPSLATKLEIVRRQWDKLKLNHRGSFKFQNARSSDFVKVFFNMQLKKNSTTTNERAKKPDV